MGERHGSPLERAVHRGEDRAERWREEDAALKMRADANRDALWAEAVERARLLKEAVERDPGEDSPTKTTHRIRVVYVEASEEFADDLEGFSPERERLVKVMPAGENGGNTGLRGSWLIFEDLG